jgi:phosphoglycerate-specific signal transduction histidine kinase
MENTPLDTIINKFKKQLITYDGIGQIEKEKLFRQACIEYAKLIQKEYVSTPTNK